MLQQQGKRTTDEGSASPAGGGTRLAGRIVGSVLGGSGILAGLIGALTSLSELTVDVALPLTTTGILMGVVGYAVGARGLGGAATAVATAALFFAMIISQGEFPGTEPTDHNLPDVEPRSE